MDKINNQIIKSTTNILEIIESTKIQPEDTQYILDCLETYVWLYINKIQILFTNILDSLPESK